jgi:phosphoribosyl 1,2-cyclic phosphodiesterase
MSLFISSLNSGSNGNCYYIGDQHDAILVDAGLSCREIEKRMHRSGLSIHKVRAIFITHEHTDHIKGVEAISKKYKLPVHITRSTLTGGRLILDNSLVQHFKAYDEIIVGNMKVIPFPKLHDASEPHSFIIKNEHGITVGVFTDIGFSCSHVISGFKQCHAAFLEANYDEQMLEMGGYPYYLKKRIRSDKGHLSNDQALELFRNHRSPQLSHILLSHLSKDNNSPDLVSELFMRHAGNTEIIIASRYNESKVFHVTGSVDHAPIQSMNTTNQMSLF